MEGISLPHGRLKTLAALVIVSNSVMQFKSRLDIFMPIRHPCFCLSLGEEKEEGSGKREGKGRGR